MKNRTTGKRRAVHLWPLAVALIFCTGAAHALVVSPGGDSKPMVKPSDVRASLGMKSTATGTQTDTATAPPPAPAPERVGSSGAAEIAAMRAGPRVKDESQAAPGKAEIAAMSESRSSTGLYVLAGFAALGVLSIVAVRLISRRANRERFVKSTGPSIYDE